MDDVRDEDVAQRRNRTSAHGSRRGTSPLARKRPRTEETSTQTLDQHRQHRQHGQHHNNDLKADSDRDGHHCKSRRGHKRRELLRKSPRTRPRTVAAASPSFLRRPQTRSLAVSREKLQRRTYTHASKRAQTCDVAQRQRIKGVEEALNAQWDEVWTFLPKVHRSESANNEEEADDSQGMRIFTLHRRDRPSTNHRYSRPEPASSPRSTDHVSYARPKSTTALSRRPVNPFFQSRESPARPLTTMAVGQPVPRRARTAQAPIPLPFLDATSGACRGWLFRQGEFAHDILDLEQVHQQLQWRPFYFVADSQARSLIQLRSPACEKAQKVARLDGAVIAGRGFRRMPHGDGVFVMEIVSKTGIRDCTERWVLGCPDERTALRWLQVLRFCALGKPPQMEFHSNSLTEDDVFGNPCHGNIAADIFSSDDESDEEKGAESKNSKALVAQFSLRLFDGVPVRKELEKCGLVLRPDGSVLSIELEAVLCIQSFWRGRLAYAVVFGERGMLEQSHRAIQIQAWCRQIEAVTIAQKRRRQRDAAIAIQCLARSSAARGVLRVKRSRAKAARQIQGAYRAHTARQLLWDLQRARRQLLAEHLDDVLDQVTRHCENHAALRLELSRRASALRLQCFWRRQLARKRADRIRRYRAATKLQAAYIGSRHWKAYRELRIKVLRIQSLARRRAGMLAVREKRRQLHGAQTMQKLWRGHLARRQYAETKRAVIILQSFARRVLAWRRVAAIRRENARRHSAATVVQRNERCWQVRSRFLHMRERHRAAIKIQTWCRAISQMHRWLDMSHAILVLQTFWRKIEAKHLAQLLSEARQARAAACIQRAFRAYWFWKNLVQGRQKVAHSWRRPNFLLFHGALRTSNGKAQFLKISTIDEVLNVRVEMFDGVQVDSCSISNRALLESGPLWGENYRTEIAHRVWDVLAQKKKVMASVPLSDTLKREARLQRFMRELESGLVKRLPQDWDAVAVEHTALVSTLHPILDGDISAQGSASVCSCAGTLKDKDGEAVQNVESYHPASLFGFDLEQYCSDEASDRRMLAIQDLDDVEVLIIKAVSDEAELGHFRDPLCDLETSLTQLKSIEIELSENMKRWEQSLRDLEETHAADPQEDPALADYQQYEKAYLERKILATKTILDARQESADCIAQLLEDVEDQRARFKQSKRGIFNLLAAARQKRNGLFDGENEGLQEALETYRACVEYMSVYVTSYLCRSLPDRAHAQNALTETMMTARVKIESVRVNAGALDRTINLQASHMEVVSGALLSFTDCIDARKRTVKEKMHRMDEDLNAARERWLQEIEDAEMELQTHRERYEKVHQAEEDARMLIDEERAAVEAYEEYQRQNRPRTKEEIAAELESEIRDLADMFDLSRRIRRFLIIVETCANKVQKTSFEARQIFIASQRAREISGAVAAGDFDQLEDQCIRIGKRLRTGRFLLADLQSAFEFHYPELRHRLFTLKDEVQLEHGRRRSLRGSGESGALSDSDSDSEYSVPEEFADGKMNLDRAIHSCAQDVEYLADLCSEWAEVVGPEEAQRRRQQADPQDDSNTEAQVADHAPKSRLERIAKAPKEGLQRSYVLYVNRKERFRNRVLAPALKRAGDPFGAKEARRHEAATTIQRHVRGFLCRKRLLIEAVIRVQLAYRKFKAYKKFKKALFASTAKYYDVISCRYYYVWAGGKVAWAPPEPIADWYIPYGKRTKRPLGYEWTNAEAATLIQSIVRARAERKRYVQRVMESFEKVYEPSRQACFYQNKFTGKCQWHKPLGLGLLDIPIANLDTEGFVER